MSLADAERRLRLWRGSLWKRLWASRRGRKLLFDAMPDNIVAITLDTADHRVTVAPADLIGRHVFSSGAYARQSVDRTLAFLVEEGLLVAGGVALEIGANIGTHTIYMARTHLFSRIVAIEPDPRNYALLLRNIADNELKDIVIPINCAAGAVAGRLPMGRVARNFGGSSLLYGADRADAIHVDVKPVPEILAAAGVAPELVSFIWMDIEGYEPVASQSMHDLMMRRVPMHMEFSPPLYGSGTREFVEMLSLYYCRFNKSSNINSSVSDIRGLNSIFSVTDIILY